MRIKQKTADDDAIYKRAKKYVAQGDESFKPLLEWYKNGKKRTINPEDYPLHLKLLKLLRTHYANVSANNLAKEFKLYPVFFYRLRCKEFTRLPVKRCRRLIEQIEERKSS